MFLQCGKLSLCIDLHFVCKLTVCSRFVRKMSSIVCDLMYNIILPTARNVSTSSNKHLHLSEALLLAPKTDMVTRKNNFWIKEALFDFIADTQVKL